MKRLVLVALAAVAAAGAGPRDALTQARELYNQQQYDAAIGAATVARGEPDLADTAALVLARCYLERYRASRNAADLAASRDEVRQVRPDRLGANDRLEWLIALGEVLYFEGRAGAAAEQFAVALAQTAQRGGEARERVLNWWAAALDLQAQVGPDPERRSTYARLVDAMDAELRAHLDSAAASYWLAAGARGAGDLDRAWGAALAGWMRAPLMGARAFGLRADLDRLVTEAIIPERARRSRAAGELVEGMQREWELLKQTWSDANAPGS